jgi:hypothetical protein
MMKVVHFIQRALRVYHFALTRATICSLLAFVLTQSHAAPELRTYALDRFARVEEKTAVTGPLTAERSGSGTAGSGAARAYANYGVLKVFAEAHAANTGSSFDVVTDGAQASFEDVLTIDAPGKTGSRGTLQVQFTIDGTLTCSAPGWDGSRESHVLAGFNFTANNSTIFQEEYTLYLMEAPPASTFSARCRPARLASPSALRLI